MSRILPFFFFWLLGAAKLLAVCNGSFPNPITDVCWSCLFPITMGPWTLTSNAPASPPNTNSLMCSCPKPLVPAPVPGIPMSFWEPVRLIEVVREPYCMVNLGGIALGSGTNYGTHSAANASKSSETSFYHVHWYIYPILWLLEILGDVLCLSKGSFDLGWLTEFDPTWNDDKFTFLFNPEVFLFSNPLAQAACAPDCVAASVGYPLDPLFWCAGCQGSVYPFSGTVAHHAGGVQASLLLSHRFMAKGHRAMILWDTSSKTAMCTGHPMPIIKKSQYRIQMVYPVSATQKALGCHPLGRTSVFLEAGREFPYKGEDFGYLVWRRRNCCAL